MALFESKKKKDLQSQEKEAFANPSPKALANLISQYVASQDLDKALDVAKRAVVIYPDSEDLIASYQNAKRVQMGTRIMSLQKGIQSHPERKHYEALASIYYTDLNNHSKAFEIAQEALEKFPDADGLHVICGLVRMERFHKEFLSNDFREAVHHFQRASDINPMNYRAMLSLGRLNAEVGLFDEARRVFDRLQQISQIDEHVDKIKALMSEHAAEGRGTDQLDEVLNGVELNGYLDTVGERIRDIFEPPREPTGRTANVGELETFLKDLSATHGFERAVIMTLGGSVRGSQANDESTLELFTAEAKAMSEFCADASRRMDIGGFTYAEIQAPHGTTLISHARGHVLGLGVSGVMKSDEVSKVIQKFIAAVSYF